MIAPFYNRYGMAWPFTPLDLNSAAFEFEQIDTSAADAPWYVHGDWKYPPSKVCDLLTASDFTFEIELAAPPLNEYMSIHLPGNIFFSGSTSSGTVYTEFFNTNDILNYNYRWDTQVKLFQRDIDPSISYLSGLFSSRFFGAEFTNGYYDPVYEEQSDVFIIFNGLIPYPAKDQNGQFVWTCAPRVNFGVEVTRFPNPEPILYSFQSGCNYLGLPSLGGPGNGGLLSEAIITASADIEAHFTD